MDTQSFKKMMSFWATGVAVVTIPGPYGLTINSFTSLSLDPLRILFCLQRFGLSQDLFAKQSNFAVNVLKYSQKDLAHQFEKPREVDWSHIPFSTTSQGLPRLKDVLCFMECRVQEHLIRGDHEIILGEPYEVEVFDRENPLIYFAREFTTLSSS